MSTTTEPVQHPYLNGLPESQRPPGWEDDVREIRAWLKTMPHIPNITDEHIIMFLHSCYGKIEKTKATIKCYYSVRTRWPELFGQRDLLLPELQKTLDLANLVPLPTPTPEGYRVLLYRMTEYDPSKMHFVTCLKLFFMWNDICLAEDGLVPGYVVVFDMTGVSWGHLMRISLPAIRKFMIYIQDAHPARLKGVHVINTVAFMDRVLAIVKPLMKSELVQLLHLHGPVESLARFMPLSILPEDYGGDAETSQTLHDRRRHLMETRYLQWFQAEEQLKMDYSKRPNKRQPQQQPAQQPEVRQQPPPSLPPVQTCEEVESSFRSLSID
ncbi:alpha-tocopherol transfer protein [Anabrus simplex]|uniref:alpha-tocopherol transfer protein n=1 Tax=Anabrus simplex TaxID=316456 RepID=UPI0035A289A1